MSAHLFTYVCVIQHSLHLPHCWLHLAAAFDKRLQLRTRCVHACVCVQIALVAYNCNQIKAFNALCSVQCRLHGVNAIYILVVFGVLLSFHMIIINCSFSMKWLHRRYTCNYCNFFLFLSFLFLFY